MARRRSCLQSLQIVQHAAGDLDHACNECKYSRHSREKGEMPKRFVIRAEHHVKSGSMEKWLQLAIYNSRESLKETGVQRFDVAIDINDENHALIYEIYDSREAW